MLSSNDAGIVNLSLANALLISKQSDLALTSPLTFTDSNSLSVSSPLASEPGAYLFVSFKADAFTASSTSVNIGYNGTLLPQITFAGSY